MCPDWELNSKLLGYRMKFQPTEPHLPGWNCSIYRSFFVIHWLRTTLPGMMKLFLYVCRMKIYWWQISIWKDAQHHVSLGKCELKQWDTTIHLLKWQKPPKNNTKCQWGCVATHSHNWSECMIKTCWKTVWWFLTKLNILLPRMIQQ